MTHKLVFWKLSCPAFISQQMAAFLEENELFVHGDDDVDWGGEDIYWGGENQDYLLHYLILDSLNSFGLLNKDGIVDIDCPCQYFLIDRDPGNWLSFKRLIPPHEP